MSSAGTFGPADLVYMLALSKAELDIYTGDPLEYESFFAVFDETVHNRVDDDHMRLTRLLQYTGGAAKAAIKTCPLLGKDGYTKARETLKNRFGNSHLVSQKIISELKSGKSVSPGQELQQLADELVMASTALKGLKMLSEFDTQQNIRDILVRCPNYLAQNGAMML